MGRSLRALPKAHAVTPNYFDRGGARYARHRPGYPPALAQALARHCPAHRLALDVGCGSGQLSTHLGDLFAQVIATDPSASQLASATEHPNVTYRCETAESMSLHDHSADLITAAQAAHWFDLDAFYREVRRVARPSACVALLTYGVPTIKGPLGERFDKWYFGDAHRFWPASRQHVETAYRDLPFPFEALTLPALEAKRVWSASDLLNYVGTWSATRRAARSNIDLVDEAARMLKSAGATPDDTFTVCWPVRGRFGRLPAS